jgi:predicted metal-binding protein/ubiquinone/menaquinone biosynthesis C-methylase UbiE
MVLPHQQADVAREDFQFLEDLATAFWYSEVLFTLLDLNICGLLAEGPCSAKELAKKTGFDLDGLTRLLATLVALGLVIEHDGQFENGPLAARHLVPGGNHYAGDFLRYRRYLVPHWQRLTARVRAGVGANDRPVDEPRDAYQSRVFDYVRAMDTQARLKAVDCIEPVAQACDPAPRWILDLGGGAGAWCRAFLGVWPHARAVLLDLPETLAAARKLYPDPASWKRIELVAGNALMLGMRRGHFDLILLSNILHAYSEKEAKQLLADALLCLAPAGMVIVHDYLADHHDSSPLKGRLYDLHMMLNTFNGRVYSLEELERMLDEAGLQNIRLFHLPSDTSMLLAGRQGPSDRRSITRRDMLCARAQRLGFTHTRVIEAGEIAIEPWVRLKCQFGCSHYASTLTCPPFSPTENRMQEILSGFTHALLVQGAPPSKEFHDRLLSLERLFFLDGHTEALAFGAGPCPVCSACPPEGRCRLPAMARPSLEACGVDVYETARRAGLSLKPLTHRLGYVKYVGLVLFKE